MTELRLRPPAARASSQDLTALPRRRVAAVLFATVVGTLLVQTAWALAVPPFRGLDEHDHAYRAASVARGDWGAHHKPSPIGRGEMVTVPEDVVLAAQPICEALPYTDAGNCSPVEQLGGGSVTVASSAARYHPLFYSLIGTPSRFFDGADALMAMRMAGAVLCALFIGLAALTTRLWARTPWPTVALLLVATPTLLFSTALAAPNGLEASSAMLVWAAVLGLARSSLTSNRTRTFLVLATVGALPLATVRGLGVLWLLLIVGTVAALLPSDHLKQLLRRRDALICSGVVATAAALGVWWTLHAKAVDSSVGADHISGSPWPGMPGQIAVWLLGSVAAIPNRTVPAPLTVYATVLVGWSILVLLGVKLASWRARVALAGIVVISTAIPIAATVVTYEQLGWAWQGRYTYPYAMGFLLVCGYALDRSRRAPWLTRAWPVWSAAAILLIGGLIAQLDLIRDEWARSASEGYPATHGPTAAVVVLTVAGAALLGWALTRRLGSPAPQ